MFDLRDQKKSDSVSMGKYASLKQIASLIMLDERTINRSSDPKDILFRDFPKEGRGQYDIVKCVHWRIKDLQRQLEETRGGKIREAQERRALAQAKKEEFELEKYVGNLLYTNDVLDFLRKFGSLIVKEFESIGRECQARFKYLKDDVEKIDEVVKIKDKTLDAIATTNINSLLPDSIGNPAASAIKNRKRISRKLKTKAGSKNK